MNQSDPEYQAYQSMKSAMERVAVYQGQDGRWYATVKVEGGIHLEGPFDAEDEAQEGGLRTAMNA